MPRGFGGRSRAGRGGGGILSVQVAGADQLAALSKRLKGADKAYRRELRIGLNRAVKPLREQVKADMPNFMPDRYAGVLRKAFRPKTVIRTGGMAAVRLTATAKGRHKDRDVRALNRGSLRHPLFGDRDWWYAQKVKAGFWDVPLKAAAPKVRQQILKVIDDVNKKLESG